jgi:alpha-1,2-mannosyltransferase
MLAEIRSGNWLTDERVRAYAAMMALIGCAGLLFIWTTGGPMTDRFGKPIGTDFASFWTAGRMALAGDAVSLYDPWAHAAFQRQVFGDPNIEIYAWHYPPFFLAVAVPLALLPYVPAFVVWQGATLALYVAAIRAIAPPHKALNLVILGFPAVFVTLGHGQNAFLTAGLLGLALMLLDRRPWIAGLLIGLLAYKPQLGLVLPVVLVFGGHWRAAIAAGITVITMAALATGLLSLDVWVAFLKDTAHAREHLLEHSVVGWAKIQSVFSALRSFGVPVSLAYTGQFAVTAAVVSVLALSALRGADRRLVAAMTCVGALLATPFCLDYDMALLGPALAFAAAYGTDKGFHPYEKSVMALAWFVPLVARGAMMGLGVPLGVLVMATFFAILARRMLAETPGILPLRLARG